MGTPPPSPIRATRLTYKEVGIRAPWPWNIQHLAMAFTRVDFLFEEPWFSLFIAKNAMRPGDHARLCEVETNELYDNAIHSAMECIWSIYLAKECNKGLRRMFKAQEWERNFLQEDCQWLKARVFEVKNTMKETLESVDKLQAELNKTNVRKADLEAGLKLPRIK